jgi:HSP20 family protein
LVPAADVIETADAIRVRMDLPGHEATDIHVNVENDVLTVRSERKTEKDEKGATSHYSERSYGLYTRSLVLPAPADAQKAEARYENGVLSITLPKREDAKPKALDVKVQS